MLLKRGFLYEIKKNKTMFLMVSPTILFFIIFSYIPMVGIYYAFTNFNFNGGLFGSPFIGFKNFDFLIRSGTLFRITANTILYNIAFILIGNVLQIITAIFLSEVPRKFFKKTTQSIMFLPYFISYVLIGAFVYNLFNYDFGTMNSFLKSIGSQPVDIYGISSVWRYILVAFYVWKGLGYGSVIYLAAIMGISEEIYEASQIDGANIFRQIWHITLPLLKPTFILLILFSLGSILRGQFDLFYQIIGNNGLLFSTTDIIDTFVVRSVTNSFNIGMGTAAGLYQSFFGMILVLTVNYIIKKTNEEYALF